ncbi:GAP family protein [Synechococcus sp. Tobar12-5m-g]|uniref:GAP family protein n=1 Tax=unclassified Synechococcus TaxID=2626047 RepID=UPI0020CE6E0B|nr:MULTISPECIES: GAP family protein [unclassified Synechococcus]MCP9773100.1 GAP family protein [Synechococcus sp. Tobar12-5m-g]MCP9873938.1 GAP family protein [Synechococcus sp. Cruz CV-v-12]
MGDPILWTELIAYGSGISLSPIHIGLLLLLLLGPDPLRRGGLFVLSWMVTIAVMVALLLTVGHGLLLSMEQGSSHRTGLDLMGAGALLALGIRDLLPTKEARSEPAGWVRQLDRFCALPLPLLIGASSAIEVISPDDLFLLAKGASALLAADLNRSQELLLAGGFTLAASLLLLVPFLAVALGRSQVLPLLQRGKDALYANGELVVGGLSLALAAYLAWQGIEGLRLA